MGERMAIAVLMTALMAGAAPGIWAQEGSTQAMREVATMATQTKFYCNIRALNPAARVRHKQLTEKLIAARKETVETEKGYEFQYSPSNVSLAEIAEWAVAESRCCPFFDFHIDLEREGHLLCLRLTGEEGIKPFILSEFQVPKK